MTTVPSLPTDVIILIFHYLPLASLAAFARTSKFCNELVNEYGWSEYLRNNSRPSQSLYHTTSKWDTRARVRYNALTDSSWANTKFVARPLSRPWPGKQQPRMATSNSRLLIAAGRTIYDYVFIGPDTGILTDAPAVRFNGKHDLVEAHHQRLYITSITFVPDSGRDRTVCVGFSDGMLEQVTLPPTTARGDRAGEGDEQQQQQHPDTLTLDRRIHVHEGDVMEHLSCARTTLLSLSSSGLAGLWDMTHSAPSPALIDLDTKSWVCHLALSACTPYAAFGTSSNKPLAVHPIAEAALSPRPIAILHTQQTEAGRRLRPSAVYGITGSPDASPWGGSEQVIISGWYDSKVRVHDMRSSSRLNVSEAAAGSGNDPAPLKPVMSFRDPWSYEPIYTVACGGGGASHIAAGSARHSVVAFWDARSPNEGWSVHAPGNDPSPVYAMALEGSRLFGATQSRPFVYDFGPGVTEDTYPPINRRDELVKTKDGGPGFYVTKYYHRCPQEATL